MRPDLNPYPRRRYRFLFVVHVWTDEEPATLAALADAVRPTDRVLIAEAKTGRGLAGVEVDGFDLEGWVRARELREKAGAA